MPEQPLLLSPHVRKLLQKGIKHHRAGRRGPAKACYQRGLKADPKCPQALHLLGLLAQEARQYRESIEFIERAVDLSPNDPDALNSLAESYLGLGEHERAIHYYRRLVDLRPESAVAQTQLAKTQERFGDLKAASVTYRRALALQPDSAEAHCQLAEVARQLEHYGEAKRLCEQALKLEPNRVETHCTLAGVFTEMKDLAGAVNSLRRAATLSPDSPLVALALGRYFIKCGDLTAAEASYRRAVQLDPNASLTHFRLGATLSQLGERQGAWESYERALAVNPQSHEIISHIALMHLAEGNFALGWSEYEQRDSARRARRNFSQPQWKGEPLNGKRIFLHAEQGIGDALQSIRYIPMVAARGGKIILGIQTKLRRLLAVTEGVWKFVYEGETPPEFDCHCPLLSLPCAFGTDLNSIPGKIPYIYPSPGLVEAWRNKLQWNSLRVGLVWGGNPKHPYELWRSIKLEQFASLTNLPGAVYYSLQMGPPARELKQVGSGIKIIDLQSEQKDFADTAAIVANLDLVISIDTSVAHLAGAMGKPVWILLHKSPDWRWLLAREDSPWYPTAHLFRQSTLGNWKDVLTRVELELGEIVARSTMKNPIVSLRR